MNLDLDKGHADITDNHLEVMTRCGRNLNRQGQKMTNDCINLIEYTDMPIHLPNSLPLSCIYLNPQKAGNQPSLKPHEHLLVCDSNERLSLTHGKVLPSPSSSCGTALLQRTAYSLHVQIDSRTCSASAMAETPDVGEVDQ